MEHPREGASEVERNGATSEDAQRLCAAIAFAGHREFVHRYGDEAVKRVSVFAEFERDVMRERVRAGFGGCALARDAPWATADDRWQSGLGQDLFLAGIRKSKIARRLKIDQTSVRLLEEKKS